jgi:hypothetical protein
VPQTETGSKADRIEPFSREIAWFRYLYCSQVLKLRFEASLKLPTEEFVYWDNPTGFVYMMYFYGSLYAVIEGWKELQLESPIINSILERQGPVVELLRRCRNAAFHYQSDLMIPKLAQLLKAGDKHVIFVHQIHDEFVRYYWNRVEGLCGTEQEKTELKSSLRHLAGWFPRTLKDDERAIRADLEDMVSELQREDLSGRGREIATEAKSACEAALEENRRACEELEKIRNRNLAVLCATVLPIDFDESMQPIQ